MTISNISGNALSDIGITPTTYISEFGSDIDAAKLRDQINIAQQEVTASLTRIVDLCLSQKRILLTLRVHHKQY